MASSSVSALPHIEFSAANKSGVSQVLANGVKVGTLTRPTHAPKSFKGFFLRLDGVTWNNSPGARQTADSGFFDATMVSSHRQAKQRIEQHYKDKNEALANAAASR